MRETRGGLEGEEADFNSQSPMPTHHPVVRGRSRARAENEASRGAELVGIGQS
jgi:hypothetical protein